MAANSILVLGVALLTWGGVFLYLLRLAALAKGLEAQLKSHQVQQEEARREAESSAEVSDAPLSLP